VQYVQENKEHVVISLSLEASHAGAFFFLNLHSGGWNQGPLDTVVT
jgi:hypothetical protein